MSSSLEQQKEIPALGRLAALGMLYDIRTNQLIMGKTLWSPEALQSNVATVLGRSSKEEFFVSEKTLDKIQTVTSDLNLQLNLLCQTDDFRSTASYLRDSKYLRHQAQASFKYEITTEVRHLTMEHLKEDKIQHPEILKKGIATHVIVGIKYGGQIIMNFVEELEKKECSQKLKCELLVEKLMGVFSANGDGSHTGNDYGRIESIKCHLYSDFLFDTSPTNVKEAVELYKKLPSLTSGGNIGIPVLLYLCPLESLGGKGAGTVKEIRSSLVRDICFIQDKIQVILASCEDLVEADNFPSAKRNLRLFIERVQRYKDFFLQNVSELHRDISCGSADNDDLDTFLKEQECSVFSHSSLSKWLSVKEEEMKAMQGLIKSLNTPFVGRGELKGYFLNPNIYHVVCLAFKFFPDTDNQLQNMERFLKKEPVQEFEQPVMMPFDPLVRPSLERFLTLRDDNRKCQAAKFVITEEPLGQDPNEKPGAFLRYYYKGKLKASDLLQFAKCQNLRVVSISDECVEFAWDNSLEELNDIQDEVRCYRDDDCCSVQFMPSYGEKKRAKIVGLKPATKYTFALHSQHQIFLRDFANVLGVETLPAPISNKNVGIGIGISSIVVFGLWYRDEVKDIAKTILHLAMSCQLS